MATDPRLDDTIRGALRSWLDASHGPHPTWDVAPAARRVTSPRWAWPTLGRLALVTATLAVIAALGGAAFLGGWRPQLPAFLVGPTNPSPSVAGCPGCFPTPSPSLAPTPSATPSLTPTPTSPTDGFSCAYPLYRGGDATMPANVGDVRVGTHAGYDRIVFQVDGSLLPSLEISQVSPPFARDPSGLPLSVEGKAFVRLLLRNAEGHDLAVALRDQQPGYPVLTELAMQGDFEGVYSWIAGLEAPTCVRVTTLTDPTRIVIDLQQP